MSKYTKEDIYRMIEEEDVDTMKQKMIISTQRRKQFDPKGE